MSTKTKQSNRKRAKQSTSNTTAEQPEPACLTTSHAELTAAVRALKPFTSTMTGGRRTAAVVMRRSNTGEVDLDVGDSSTRVTCRINAAVTDGPVPAMLLTRLDEALTDLGRPMTAVEKRHPAGLTITYAPGPGVEVSAAGRTASIDVGTGPVQPPRLIGHGPPTWSQQVWSGWTIDVAPELRRALAAASSDETLPVIRGVGIEDRGAGVTATGTDRFVMTETKLPVQGLAKDRFTIPRDLLEPFLRAAGTAATALSLSYNRPADDTLPRTVTLRAGNLTATSTANLGDFPSTDKLWPATADIAATIIAYRAELEFAARIATRQPGASKTLRLWADEHDGSVRYCTVDQRQSAEGMWTDLPQASAAGSTALAAVDPRRLLGVLSTIDGPTVQLGLTSMGRPMTIAAASGAEVPGRCSLLMPLRAPSGVS